MCTTNEGGILTSLVGALDRGNRWRQQRHNHYFEPKTPTTTKLCVRCDRCAVSDGEEASALILCTCSPPFISLTNWGKHTHTPACETHRNSSVRCHYNSTILTQWEFPLLKDDQWLVFESAFSQFKKKKESLYGTDWKKTARTTHFKNRVRTNPSSLTFLSFHPISAFRLRSLRRLAAHIKKQKSTFTSRRKGRGKNTDDHL